MSHQNEPRPPSARRRCPATRISTSSARRTRYPHGGATTCATSRRTRRSPITWTSPATLGIERFVFVQPSAYGRDNACMLDAMREVGIERCRGIVDVDEDAPDSLLAEMDALGVRGVRINVSPVKPPEAGFAERCVPRIERARRALRRARLAPRLPDARLADRGADADLRANALPFTSRPHGHVPREGRPKQPGFESCSTCCATATGAAG